MSTPITKVSTPRIDSEKEKNKINPKTARKTPKVIGINSGKMKISAPVTNGIAETTDGILKAINKNPKATKYPPAIRYRKSGYTNVRIPVAKVRMAFSVCRVRGLWSVFISIKCSIAKPTKFVSTKKPLSNKCEGL